jgi:hypothetical protein
MQMVARSLNLQVFRRDFDTGVLETADLVVEMLQHR